MNTNRKTFVCLTCQLSNAWKYVKFLCVNTYIVLYIILDLKLDLKIYIYKQVHTKKIHQYSTLAFWLFWSVFVPFLRAKIQMVRNFVCVKVPKDVFCFLCVLSENEIKTCENWKKKTLLWKSQGISCEEKKLHSVDMKCETPLKETPNDLVERILT